MIFKIHIHNSQIEILEEKNLQSETSKQLNANINKIVFYICSLLINAKCYNKERWGKYKKQVDNFPLNYKDSILFFLAIIKL